MRPLAEYLGVERLVANRLEFRDGLATGRLLDPVIRPRGGYARLVPLKVDGRVKKEKLARDLGFPGEAERLNRAIISTRRAAPHKARPLVLFEPHKNVARISVRERLAGKHILLIGSTGFIGKVWLAKLLGDVPEIGKVYLLIRRGRSTSAERRFEKILEQSPVFETLHQRYGSGFAQFIADRVEVIEGDVCRAGLGIAPEIQSRLAATLDLVINSSGLTDFNPDLREALAINVDATVNLLDFLRQSDHAALLHLSTCYVVGSRDGRIKEDLTTDYTPKAVPDFDAARERDELHALVKDVERRSQSAEVMESLREQARAKANGAKQLTEAELDARARKYRSRWLRNEMVAVGVKRAKELGWPNTYTFTKSLAESLIAR